MKISDYTIEYCPWCDSEQVIYSIGITACPNCGKPLAPCSVCDGCSYYLKCPYGCDGSDNDGHKPIDRHISQNEIDNYLKKISKCDCERKDKICMNKEILDIINAVIDYKKFICSNNRIFPKENFDWFSETEKYYKTLPLPEGVKHNRIDFEKILGYSEGNILSKLNKTEYSGLYSYVF